MSTTQQATMLSSGPGQTAGQGPADDLEIGEVCIANISPRERRKRLMFGVVTFGVSFAILAALIAGGAERGWRLILFLLFWSAAAGVFQWRDKT